MTRFKFELEPLLQMNAAVADLRESELHKCRQDVARRETAILKIQEERQQLYQSTFGRVVDPVELRRTLFQIECLDENIKPI